MSKTETIRILEGKSLRVRRDVSSPRFRPEKEDLTLGSQMALGSNRFGAWGSRGSGFKRVKG